MERKLTRSECGKLGGIKGGKFQIDKWKTIKDEYYSNPVVCESCPKPINFYHRKIQRFCSHTCRAKVINRTRMVLIKYNCLHCSSEKQQSIKLTIPKKFCNKDCEKAFKKSTSWKGYLKLFEEGALHNRWIIRRILLSRKPYCWSCGIAWWRKKKLSLEVDHKNGNPGDDRPKNVRLVCPNCHSITKYYKGKNRGNGRKSRGLPLH